MEVLCASRLGACFVLAGCGGSQPESCLHTTNSEPISTFLRAARTFLRIVAHFSLKTFERALSVQGWPSTTATFLSSAFPWCSTRSSQERNLPSKTFRYASNRSILFVLIQTSNIIVWQGRECLAKVNRVVSLVPGLWGDNFLLLVPKEAVQAHSFAMSVCAKAQKLL